MSWKHPPPSVAARKISTDKPRLDWLLSASNLWFVVQTFHAETVVEKNGKLQLEHLPFAEGESVHVFVSSSKPAGKRPLRGTVVKYEQPFASAANEDWEAAK